MRTYSARVRRRTELHAMNALINPAPLRNVRQQVN